MQPINPSRSFKPFRIALVCLAGVCASVLHAQSGPFQDGELLVWTDGPGPTYGTLYRIDAGTGHGEALIDQLYMAYLLADGFEYEPYRDALLLYAAWAPTGIFSPRLFQVESDGTVSDLGFDNLNLSSFAPVGDGRVYLRQNGTLSILDANNQLSTVLDENGLPITLEVEHLVYDPTENALIGAAPHSSSNPCSSGNAITFHKLLLDPTGTQLTGPIICSGYSTATGLNAVGLDYLPSGKLQASVAGGQYSNDKVLLEIDPSSMTVTVRALIDYNDLNGGVWSQRIGSSIVLEDTMDELRVYAPGQGGAGTLLPADVPLGDSTSGVSARSTFADIDIFAGCAGLALSFGQGLAGTGGVIPVLSAGSCPRTGTSVQLRIDGGVGGGLGVLVVGQQTLAYSILGGTGYVLPPFDALLAVPLGGVSGTAGQGSGVAIAPAPNDPSLVGVPLFLQAGILDSGAPAKISLTQALEIRLG